VTLITALRDRRHRVIVPESAEYGHGTLPPNAILLVAERIDMRQMPAGREEPVDFLPSARFKIVSRNFREIEFPKRLGVRALGEF